MVNASSSENAAVPVHPRILSPSATHRKSCNGKDSRREPRPCKPHPCMAAVMPTNLKRASSDRVDYSERGSKYSDSPNSETDNTLCTKESTNGSRSRDTTPLRGLYPPTFDKRSLFDVQQQRGVSSPVPCSHKGQASSGRAPRQPQTKYAQKSNAIVKNDRAERQLKPPLGNTKEADAATVRHSNRVKGSLERSQSERYRPNYNSEFQDSDTFTLESNYDGQELKPFLQLCFDDLEEVEGVKEEEEIDEVEQNKETELALKKNTRRSLPSRAISLHNVVGLSSPSERTNERESKSSPPTTKKPSPGIVDRRTQLQKSKSISLRAVECKSVRDMKNIITSNKVEENQGSISTTFTADESPSPSTSSYPYEPSFGVGDDSEGSGAEGFNDIQSARKVPVASGLFKSLTTTLSSSRHGISGSSSHSETPKMSQHKRSSHHRRLNLKVAGETFSLISQKLFTSMEGEATTAESTTATIGPRKRIWGSASERRDRTIALPSHHGLGAKSSHELQGSSPYRPDFTRMESTASITSHSGGSGSSVISCSTIDRRRLLERSKSTTSVASFAITPSHKSLNTEHLRLVNTMVFDSSRPLTQESRESLHALLTDTIDLVTQKEAPTPVLEKYRGVSGDELVELMKNFSKELNATMNIS